MAKRKTSTGRKQQSAPAKRATKAAPAAKGRLKTDKPVKKAARPATRTRKNPANTPRGGASTRPASSKTPVSKADKTALSATATTKAKSAKRSDGKSSGGGGVSQVVRSKAKQSLVAQDEVVAGRSEEVSRTPQGAAAVDKTGHAKVDAAKVPAAGADESVSGAAGPDGRRFDEVPPGRPGKSKPAVVPPPEPEAEEEPVPELPKTRLTDEELEFFRQMLLEKRRELLGDVATMEDQAMRGSDSSGGLGSSMPIHMADLGTDTWEQEFTLGLIEKERSLVREIDEALDRIDQRTYGVCMATGRPITKARLKAKPWAKYCIEYARELENRRR